MSPLEEWTPALRTEQDYVAVAMRASPKVRRVRVRGAGNTPGFPPYKVEVRPRGRFGRRLKRRDFVAVHVAIVELKPAFIQLKMVE